MHSGTPAQRHPNEETLAGTDTRHFSLHPSNVPIGVPADYVRVWLVSVPEDQKAWINAPCVSYQGEWMAPARAFGCLLTSKAVSPEWSYELRQE